jgi:hypothetical protein
MRTLSWFYVTSAVELSCFRRNMRTHYHDFMERCVGSVGRRRFKVQVTHSLRGVRVFEPKMRIKKRYEKIPASKNPDLCATVVHSRKHKPFSPAHQSAYGQCDPFLRPGTVRTVAGRERRNNELQHIQ